MGQVRRLWPSHMCVRVRCTAWKPSGPQLGRDSTQQTNLSSGRIRVTHGLQACKKSESQDVPCPFQDAGPVCCGKFCHDLMWQLSFTG